MHTKTYLKAAMHQLGLAKSETREFGHAELSQRIEAAEQVLALLIRESYAMGTPEHQEHLRAS